MKSYLALKPRHQQFVDSYIEHGAIATKALQAIGYKGKNAKQLAFELMQRPEIQAALAERFEEAIAEKGVTNHRILGELADIGFGKVTAGGTLKHADKIRALEILAKYKKLLVDQVEFPAGIPLAPPVINIGFANGGPGTTIAKRDTGA